MKNRQRAQASLEKGVLKFIRQHRLLSSGDRLVVAVSGGADSVCLLHLLLKLRDELNLKPHVAHFNHQLRGAEADDDARFVVRLAEQFDLPVTVGQHDVGAYQRHQRFSSEEAARELRYAFLSEIAGTINAKFVAVGHTTDDHIETILIHLVRGTGTRGLIGLQPSVLRQDLKNKITIIRPLLNVTREETTDYCREEQLNPRNDSSNLSHLPLRNRVRQQLLPLLQSYNPQVTKALLRTATINADDLIYLEKQTSRLRSKIVKKQADTIILDKEPFLKASDTLKRLLLRLVIEELVGNLKDIEARHIEGIMAVLSRTAGKRIDLPGGLIFTIEYDRYLLGTDPAALSPFPALSKENVFLKVPGETRFSGWNLTGTVKDRGNKPLKEKTDETSAVLTNNGTWLPESNLTAYLDLDKTGNELRIRSRRTGDRFQPLGMKYSKKLAQFMIDVRIPLAWRQGIPIICSDEQIIWVAGYRIDERVKVTKRTKRILCLKFRPNPENSSS